MSDQHSSPIRTPQQLVTVIVLSFVVPVLIIVLLVKYVVGDKTSGAGSSSMTPEAVADRLKPIGSVVLAEAGSAKTLQTGEAVYKLACAACHAAGIAGAPKTGDAGPWAPRLKQGFDTLVKHAVEGFKGMPAKGGNADLDPVEVARAVAYLGSQAGAKFKEPDAPAAAGSKHVERTGQEVAQGVCSACHAEGKGGAPKIGNWDDWKPRVAKGLAALTESSIHGHKGMPARGGMAEISDVEMRRAVEYMFKSHIKPGAAAAVGTTAATTVVAAASAMPGPGKADGAAGEKLYKQACTACHAAGVAGAPKLGDKAAWAPRITLGVDALVSNVLKGKGAMPPRGAAGNASDAEIRAAVEYVVAQAK
jgi:cytochrome c5